MAVRRNLIVALTTLGLGLVVSCGPPLEVREAHGSYVIDVQQLGEYVSTVNRLQLKDGNETVWEIRAKGKVAQTGGFELHLGANPARVDNAYYGEYVTVTPSSDTFTLKPNREYTVLAWGKRGWPSTFTFRTETAAPPNL